MNENPTSLGGRVVRLALVLAAFLVIVAAGWTFLTLSWAYSEGERAGVLQKFSKKGWICKTYEGEIAQYVVGGVAPQIWYFSVRDEAAAAQLFKDVGQSFTIIPTARRDSVALLSHFS